MAKHQEFPRIMAKNQLVESPFKDAAAAAQMLLQEIITDFKGSAVASAGDNQRLFFPNGIELIDVVFKIGGGDVEVTIAGAKSPKLEDSGAKLTMRRSVATIDYMDVAAEVNSDYIFRGDYLVWYNEGNEDVTIRFTAVCPLKLNNFTVLANGGMTLTLVKDVNTIPAGTYPFTPIWETGQQPAGNPKIIIQ
jgi:hypothetical protein